ncbi:dTDP-4-dehydrorhamnose 3,5-epimerase [Acidithiobacillus montserratensis]|uniref:dTDP-4-dehydrorhamnose 3,5-epimerase n=1 Tax=Acidithiobacillus montserratensis TaxID=2729135 RepID=A0ACD5HGG7_9PROT|nr:dTDP-4-dehydrorhamnose 3,5-epimerase [Acidithiobacillus montserratensis]MBN2679567.1 dTDP-4-dehydrorhamnose 3,5-epimerase [Acidithiobacillaceae bacterium]MBU2746944.1 dTDP-4-dehydrorhamnose 3,5-epimerase [Acidithiobacillus montserratensis]
MNVIATVLPEVLILEPKVFGDERGFFLESYNRKTFATDTGLDVEFVQDNHSRSVRGVLRGIHYQLVKPQGKLVRVVSGRVWDVAVDLRRSSPHFGKWAGVELSADNHRQFWVPPGFGHAFVVLSASADFLYKTTEYWYPEHDRNIIWNDPDLAIDWALDGETPQLAAKDAAAPRFAQAEIYR